MSLNNNMYDRKVTTRIPSRKKDEFTSPTFQYHIKSKYPHNISVDTDYKSQVNICQDILYSLLNLTEASAERCINKLTSKGLKQKFIKLNQEYYYKNYRKDNLTFKISSFNDILKEMASQQLVNPTIKLMNDDIKELDRAALDKVIRLTNDSKEYTKIMKRKGENFGVTDAMNFVTAESLPTMSELSSLKNEYQLIKNSLKFEQQQKMKKQVQKQKAVIKQLQVQKNDMMNHMVGKDKMKGITPVKSLKQEKQRSVNANFIPTSNKTAIEKNQASKIRLIEEKQFMNQQLMQYKKRVEQLQKTVKDKEDQYSKLKNQRAKTTEKSYKELGKHKILYFRQETSVKSEASRSKQQLINFQNQYQQQRKENRQNQQKLDSKIKQINQLVSKSENNQKTIVNLNKQKDDQAAEIKRLSAQIDKEKLQREKQIEEAATQIKQIRSLKEQLNKQKESLSLRRGDITILQNIKNQLEKQMKQKQEKIIQLESQINRLKRENNQSLTQNIKSSQQLRQNEKLVEQLITQQGSTKQQIKRLNKIIEEQNFEQMEMKNLLTNAEKSYQQLKANHINQVQSKKKEIMQMERQYQQKKEEMRLNNEKFTEKYNRLLLDANKAEQVKSLNEAIFDLKLKIQSLNQEKKTLKENNDQLILQKTLNIYRMNQISSNFEKELANSAESQQKAVELEKQLEQVQNTLNSQAKELLSVNSIISSLRTAYSESQSLRKDVERKFEILQQQLEKAMKQISHLNERNKEMLEKIHEQQQEQNNSSNFKEQLLIQRERVKSLSEAQQHIQNALTAQKAEKEQIAAELIEYRQKVREQIESNERLNHQLSEQKHQNQELANLVQSQQKIVELEKQLEYVQNTLNDKTEQLLSANNSISNLKTAIEDQQTLKKDVERKAVALENQAERGQLQIGNLNKRHNDLEAKIKQQENQAEKRKEEYVSLEAQAKQLSETQQHCKNALTAQKSEKERITEELIQQRQKLREQFESNERLSLQLNEQKHQNKEQINQLHQRYDILLNENSKLIQDAKTNNEEISKLRIIETEQSKIDLSSSENNAIRAENKFLAQQNARQPQQINEFTQKLQAQTNKRIANQQNIAILKQQLQKASQTLKNNQQHLKATENTNEELRNNLENTIKTSEEREQSLKAEIQKEKLNVQELKKELESERDENISATLNLQNSQIKEKDFESKCNILQKSLKQLQKSPNTSKDGEFEILADSQHLQSPMKENKLQYSIISESEIKIDNSLLNKQIEELQKRLEQASAEYLRKQDQSAKNYQQKLDQLKQQNNQLSEQLLLLGKQFAIMQSTHLDEMQVLRQQLQNQKDKLTKIQNQLLKNAEQLKKLNAQTSSLKADLHDKTRVSNEVLNQLQSYKDKEGLINSKELERFRSEREKDQQITNLRLNANELEVKLVKKDEELNKLQSSHEIQLTRLNEEKANMSQTIQRLSSKLGEQQRNVVHLKEQLAERQKESEIMENEFTKIRRNLQSSLEQEKEGRTQANILNNDLKLQVQRQTYHLKEQQQQAAGLVMQLKEKQSELQATKIQVDQTRKTLQQYQKDRTDNKKNMISSLESEVENISTQLYMQKRKAIALSSQLKQKQEEAIKRQIEYKLLEQNLESHISRLSESIVRLAAAEENARKLEEGNIEANRKMKEITAESEERRIKLSRLQYANDNFERTFERVNNQLESCRKNMSDLATQHQRTLEKQKSRSAEIAKLTQELDILNKKNIQLEELFEKLSDSNERLEISLAQRDKELSAERQLSSNLRKTLEEKPKPNLTSEQRTKFEKKMKEYKDQIQDLTHQIEVLNQTLEEVTKMNQSMEAKEQQKGVSNEIVQGLEREIQLKSQEIDRKNKQIAILIQRQNQLLRKQQELSEQLKRKQDERKEQLALQQKIINDLTNEKQTFTAELQKLNNQAQQLALTISLKDNELSTLQQSTKLMIKQHRQYVDQLKEELGNLQQKLRVVSNQYNLNVKQSDLSINHLFQNEILQFAIEHKRFLKEAIENHMRLRIIKTKLIYRFDPLNKVNFHAYFDFKENLVVIARMENGYYIAGYSEGSFEPKKASQRDGLIIALNKQEVFTLAERNKRAITYDDYFLIFGNSEIRIRATENRLFSNFAISNSYYNSRGKRVSDLLGGGISDRELNLEYYEIYQLEMIE